VRPMTPTAALYCALPDQEVLPAIDEMLMNRAAALLISMGATALWEEDARQVYVEGPLPVT